MTKVLYPAYRESLLDGTAPDLTAVDVKVLAVDNTYTYSAAHDFLDDVGGGSRIATSAALGTVTVTDGTLDADDDDLGAPTLGDTIAGLIYFVDSGVEATSQLLAFTDEDAAGAALAVSTNGETISLTLNADGLFSV